MRAHVIENGKVTNTIEVDSLDVLPNLIAATSGTIGDLWDGTAFTNPAPIPKTQEEITAETQAALAALDLKSIRTLREYIAAKPDAPAFVKQHETQAAELRVKLK